MKRFILSSFMLLFSIGSFCLNMQLQNDEIREEMKSDSIKGIVNRIDLPVININTEDGVEPSCKTVMHPEGCLGQSITDNFYVKGRMFIHKDSMLVYDSGDYSKKKSGMRIKVRGNTSADFPYKSFKIKTEVKVDFLNRDNEIYENKSWVLLNIYSTRDLRTITGFYLPKIVRNEWEPEYQFVNLFVNEEYRGLYLLAESIGYGEGRCNLKDPSGLLIEADPYWWNEDEEDPVIKTKYLPYEMGYTFKYPELTVDDPTLDRIEDYLNAFEDSLYNNKDISRYIDLKSFAGWVLVQDLLGTWDGVGSNIYVKKDDFLEGDALYQSKLQMGPLWDFDSALKTHSQWAGAHISKGFYFPELFKRPEFIKEYQDLWEEIKDDVDIKLYSFLEDFIAKEGEAIDESRRLSPPDKTYWPSTTADDITEIKNWFSERIPWMDKEISKLIEIVSIKDIKKDSEITYLSIIDISGRIYSKYEKKEAERLFNSGDYEVIKQNLLPGIYIMQAEYADGSKVSKKFVI